MMSIEEREKKVKQLYSLMEEEVKQVRRKYIDKISQLYVGNSQL